MELSQLSSERQSQTGAFLSTGKSPIDLAKPLESYFDLGSCQPTAIVPYDECDAALFCAPYEDVDRPAKLGEFDRVRQQVEQDLRQTCPVGRQRGHVFFNIDGQLQQAGGSTILDEGDGALDQPAWLEHFFVQIQLTGVDSRQIENLVDQVQ